MEEEEAEKQEVQGQGKEAKIEAETNEGGAPAGYSGNLAFKGSRFPARDLEANVPEGCVLTHLDETPSCGPQWVGRLPSWAAPFANRQSCSRSYQSGRWKGCSRSTDSAKAEVVAWLCAAMEGQTPPALSAPAPKRRKRQAGAP